MAAMLRTIVHTSSAISCVAVAAVAALMAFASPAHAYPIQLLPFDNICLDRIEAEDPQLCLSFLVQSPSARSCLNSGGNLAFGKSSACWNAKRTRLPRGVVPNHTPDIAFPKSQADMIVSCLKQGRSARLAGGRVSCLPTPAAVKQVASARARIPGAKIGPPHDEDEECPPNCLQNATPHGASAPGIALPAGGTSTSIPGKTVDKPGALVNRPGDPIPKH